MVLEKALASVEANIETLEKLQRLSFLEGLGIEVRVVEDPQLVEMRRQADELRRLLEEMQHQTR